jgi:hypothetical protein
MPSGQGGVNDGRREFLKKAAALPAAIAAAQATGAGQAARAAEAPSAAAGTSAGAGAAAGVAVDETKLPQIRIGKYSFSRLICGANTFNAGSHLSVFVNHEMKRYFTPEQILKTLRRCQEVGINCWQDGTGNIPLYKRFLAEGGKMHYIALGGEVPEIKTLVDGGCIAIAHHGEMTDNFFKAGQLDKVNEYLKHLRQAGVLVGVSTHMPAVVDAIESKGWDLDYFMTCVYERHRSAADLEKLLGHVPIPVGEVYLTSDPPRMFKAIRQASHPCLAFKIMAAGRLSERAEWVEQAFRDTYASIKPNDAAIVGMYDKYSDQPAENAAFVKRFGTVPAARG